MLNSVVQDGDKILIRDSKNKLIIRRGYLISYTDTRVSYINSKTSKTVLVIDDKGKYIHSFNAAKEFTSGPGWKA